MFDNQLDSIRNNFIKYLDNLGISPKSHKNYRSDLTHFTGWVILKIRSIGPYIQNLTEAIPFLSQNLASEYRSYMTENTISPKTINRRLSTLRHLSRFLVMSQIIDQDFTAGLQNITTSKPKATDVNPLVVEFRSYLEAEKISPNTIKNYLSDIRQFLAWLKTNDQQSTLNN